MQTVYLILQDIRSVHNVGSILRTADAAGVSKVLLCGCTPTPLDRFGRKRKDVAKVALGAEDVVKWEHVETVEAAIQQCKEEGVTVVAVEQCKTSVPYTEFVCEKPTVFVMGEETKGVPEEVLKQCDKIVEIPMRGEKESLNVSVATGIVLFGCTK